MNKPFSIVCLVCVGAAFASCGSESGGGGSSGSGGAAGSAFGGSAGADATATGGAAGTGANGSGGAAGTGANGSGGAAGTGAGGSGGTWMCAELTEGGGGYVPWCNCILGLPPNGKTCNAYSPCYISKQGSDTYCSCGPTVATTGTPVPSCPPP